MAAAAARDAVVAVRSGLAFDRREGHRTRYSVSEPRCSCRARHRVRQRDRAYFTVDPRGTAVALGPSMSSRTIPVLFFFALSAACGGSINILPDGGGNPDGGGGPD